MPTRQLLFLALCFCLFTSKTVVSCVSIDEIAGIQYRGSYEKIFEGENFDYLDSQNGRIKAIFYGELLYGSIDSVDIYILDPRYIDEKMVLVQIKSLILINDQTKSWNNSNHEVTVTEFWRQRSQNTQTLSGVNSTITLSNTSATNPFDISISFEIKGNTFGIKADLSFQNNILQSAYYSLFVTFLLGTQILCGALLIRQLEYSPQKLMKLSILTVTMCCILDFSSCMNIFYLMFSSPGSILFLFIPVLFYVILFLAGDMKLLYLVWSSQNRELQAQDGQLFRQKMAKFYTLFYASLFGYLFISFFFSNDSWCIILSYSLLLPQIIHNIRLGMKPSFEVKFLIGFVGTKILQPLYERGCPENILNKRQQIYTIVIFLTGFYIVKVLLLLIQFYWGSRFFVPKRFLNNYHEYKHSILLEQQELDESCSICLSSLLSSENTEESMIQNYGGLQAKLIYQVEVMRTPCEHNFHEKCLKSWMEVKMQCPMCRTSLPEQ